MLDITDKVIAVTGSTGTLAGSTARHLLSQGATVAFIGRNPEKIEKTLAEVRKISPKASGHCCNILDPESVASVVADIKQQHGKVDALINGAGGNMPGATIQPGQTIFDLDLNDYDQVLDLNLKGTLIPSIEFGKVMAEQKKGCIVNYSSMAAGPAVITRVFGYSNAKAAIDNLTRWMATEFAIKFGDGLRVNAVAPGFFISEQNLRLLTNEDGSFTDRGQSIINNTPMGRFGRTEECDGAVHYLVSDAASFVTGQVLAIDGGFSAFSGV